MEDIQFLDLGNQTNKIRTEIDSAVNKVIDHADFIQGSEIEGFENALGKYVGVDHVIGCGNGTDALQLALMALDLERGDEVIVPAFTYVATAEVISLLQLKPLLVDVCPRTFNLDISAAKRIVTKKTRAIIPVHLFGQCADMEAILNFSEEYNLYVIEDAAQSIGAIYTFSDGRKKKAGTMGHIGTTSFFPTKNLGCFGDGGAVFTNSTLLATKIKMIANHGQKIKYHHDVVGVNSRLDTLQAAILNVKLKYLDSYNYARQNTARYYDEALKKIDDIQLPFRLHNSSHVFHQYTIKVRNENIREKLKSYLLNKGIPTMIYYPLPLHFQKAYRNFTSNTVALKVSECLSKQVISLPMHTELDEDQLKYITSCLNDFFN